MNGRTAPTTPFFGRTHNTTTTQAVGRLLRDHPDLNYLVVESTGVGVPQPIAAAFASRDPLGRSPLVSRHTVTWRHVALRDVLPRLR